MSKAKRHLMLKNVSIVNDFDFGRTGQIKSCYDDGSFGVKVDGWAFICSFREDELYFPDSPEGYNQKCFQ